MSGERLYAFSKDVHSYHFYSILYWKFKPGQLGKKEKQKASVLKIKKQSYLSAVDMILALSNP